ncbi:hypothetical protein M9435_005824 [Picochlorum sp. BPE23]|nr:hypothetical protein M9435_005824 [Picochlorum sp. BPE23]
MDDTTKSKIKKQMEFYFSDSNLYRDSFLHEKMSNDSDGFVDISLVCTFNRMKQLLKKVSDDDDEAGKVKAVSEAVGGSSSLVLSEDGTRVKRATPLDKDPKEIAEEIDARSLLVGPFRFDVTLEELEEYFQSSVGKTNAVRMRRHVSSKDFRGSVFAEFGSVEEAERVLKVSEGGGFVFDGAPLAMEKKAEFVKRKEEERHARKNSPYNNDTALKTDNHASEKKEEVIEVGEKEIEEFGAVPGTFVKFDFGGADLKDGVTFGLVKDSFGGKDSGLMFVEYKQGEQTGCARFSTKETAQAALDACTDGKRLLAGFEASLTILEGEEEKEYIKKVIIMRKKAAIERAKKEKQGGGGKGRGGKRAGGRGGGRGGGKRRKTR